MVDRQITVSSWLARLVPPSEKGKEWEELKKKNPIKESLSYIENKKKSNVRNQKEDKKSATGRGREPRAGKEELTVLLQRAQKSGTPEVSGCFLNAFVCKPTFCVKEAQFKPERSKTWNLPYLV